MTPFRSTSRLLPVLIAGSMAAAFSVGRIHSDDSSDEMPDVEPAAPLMMHASADQWRFALISGTDVLAWFADRCDRGEMLAEAGADSLALIAVITPDSTTSHRATRCVSNLPISRRTAATLLSLVAANGSQAAYGVLATTRWDSTGLGSALDALPAQALGAALKAADSCVVEWGISNGSPGAIALISRTAVDPANKAYVIRFLAATSTADPRLAFDTYRSSAIHDAQLLRQIVERLYDDRDGGIDATIERELRAFAMLSTTARDERGAIWGTILARSSGSDLAALGEAAISSLSASEARLATVIMISDMGRDEDTRYEAVRVSEVALKAPDGRSMLSAAVFTRVQLEADRSWENQ